MQELTNPFCGVLMPLIAWTAAMSSSESYNDLLAFNFDNNNNIIIIIIVKSLLEMTAVLSVLLTRCRGPNLSLVLCYEPHQSNSSITIIIIK